MAYRVFNDSSLAILTNAIKTNRETAESISSDMYELSSQLSTTVSSLSSLLGASITEVAFALPASDWTESSDDYYSLQNDLYLDDVADDMMAVVIVDHESEDIAYDAELCHCAESYDGYIRFWCQNTPAQDITGTLLLIAQSNTSGYVIPTATTETLGGVIVGDGLSVTSDGVLSVDSSYSLTVNSDGSVTLTIET